MRHAPVALGISFLVMACGGRVVLGDSPADGGVEDAGAYDAAVYDAGSYEAGSYDADFQDEVFPDTGSDDDADPYDAGLYDVGVYDARVYDGAAPLCSLVGGIWDVTYNVFYGTDASFEFSADGTFIGGARGAALPAGEIYSGQWSLTSENPDGGDTLPADSLIVLSNTTGMQCTTGQTELALSFGADCATATFVNVADACTGSRKFFDATTILTKE